MPEHHTLEHVPQPVKKRGRFSNLSAQNKRSLSTHWRNVPAGFVRDLLDEEDSEDDPDFEGDVELTDEDEDALDDPLESDLVSEYNNTSENRLTSPSHDPQEQPSAGFPSTHEQLLNDVPEFEVDSLDSTDDDKDDDDDEDENFRSSLHESRNRYALNRVGRSINFGDIDLNSDDDEDDPDFEANIDPEHADTGLGVKSYDEEDEQGQPEGRDDDYVHFLMSLLADNGEKFTGEVETGSMNASEMENTNDVADGPVTVAGDEDDDFDYLRASAMVQDDPLEYREDIHVSRKEVAQLLFQSNESNLRRQTRMLRAKKAPTQPSRRPRHAEQIIPPIAHPALSGLHQQCSTGALAPRGSQEAVPNKSSAALPQSLLAPHHTSFISLSPLQIFKFKEQFGVHMQILTHVHAVCKKKVRTSVDHTLSPAEQKDRDAQCDPRVASQKTEALLKSLLENHRVSTSYHEMVTAHITKMKTFSEGLLHQKDQPLFNYETSRSAAYDKPVLDLIDPFLRECEIADTSRLPEVALKPFESYERQDVRQALTVRPSNRQYTMSGVREGWFAWTAADDKLLAMTIAKYGRECGDYANDLLPHRLEEDCQARVRYLASRRCQDNPVKRQVLHISTPLNRDELKLVETGLQQFGGKTDDPSVWKQIQQKLLPTREWSHLQKLWLWRETRRKYKATYRARLNRKKAMKQGTVVVRQPAAVQ